MTSTRGAAPDRASPSTVRWGICAVVICLVTLIAALLYGGGAGGSAIGGITSPGDLTRWGLPVTRTLLDVSGAVTVGLLGLAMAVPLRDGRLDPDGMRAFHAATWSSVVLAVAAGCTHLFTLSDLVGRPLPDALAGDSFASFTAEVAEGRAYAAVVVIALTVTAATRLVVTRGGIVATFVLALTLWVPLGLVGHASSGDYHHSAVVSLLFHLIGMSVWIGGLVAVAWYASVKGRHLVPVVRMYSLAALGCFLLVGLSGLFNGLVRIFDIADLFTTGYGQLMLVKVVVYAALCWFGWQHRERTIPSLEAGERHSFLRLATGEMVVIGTAVAVGVALGRTPPPPEESGTSLVRTLIGTPPPGPIDAAGLFGTFYPDSLFGIGILLAGGLYVAAVVRLRRRGDRWPIGRTIVFILGLLSIGVVQLTGVMTYSMTLLSVHMMQHMTLMMISPVLLVLGSPITLALRALPPAGRGRTGPREVLIRVLHSRVVRVLIHPLVALPLFITGVFVVYFTPIFEWAMFNHTGHILMSTHFLLTGLLYFEMLIGTDPIPKRPAYPLRIGLELIAAASHAVFGLALMESSRLIAADFYRTLRQEMEWLPSILEDQQLAGQLTWMFGEIPTLAVIIILVAQWIRSDAREARRFDRSEGETERQRRAYNAYLADLAERDRHTPS